MVNEIINRLDYTKTCYIELFGGSAKVLLSKPRHKVEIYNDIDQELFNLFYVVKFHLNEFTEALDGIPYMESMFYYFRDNVKNDKIYRAVRTFYLLNTSVSAKGSSFSVSFKGDKPQTFERIKSKLNIIYDRLKDVQILNRDYRKVLTSIESKSDIMLYADPPYYEVGNRYYKHKFTKEDHEILADYLNKAKYSVMVSYYEFPGIYDLYPEGKWTYHRFEKAKHAYTLSYTSKIKEKPKGVELLLLNYDLSTLPFSRTTVQDNFEEEDETEPEEQN